jgi:hypothetical protein
VRQETWGPVVQLLIRYLPDLSVSVIYLEFNFYRTLREQTESTLSRVVSSMTELKSSHGRSESSLTGAS